MRHALVATLLLVLFVTHAEAGRGTGSLKYLPDDTSIVIVGDVARARGSRVFAKLFEVARDQNAWLGTLAAAQPLDKQVDTIVLGSNTAKQGVVVLEGRIAKLAAEAKKSATSTEKHAGVTYWVTADGELAVIDNKLVFASPGLMTSVIDRAKNKKAKGPRIARTFLAATQPNTAVFGGAMFDDAMKAEMRRTLGGAPQWAAFSFAMTQKLAVETRLKFADEAAAADAAKTLGDQLTPETRGRLESFVGKEFSSSVVVEHQQSFARLAATLTAEELDRVIALAKLAL